MTIISKTRQTLILAGAARQNNAALARPHGGLCLSAQRMPDLTRHRGRHVGTLLRAMKTA